MPRYRSFRDFDWPLIAITLTLCGLGIIQIYSATHGTIFEDAWWKQIVWITLGVGLMWVVASIDYHTLIGQTLWFYGATVAGLLVTVVLAKKIFGAKRWLTIGGFNLQVSEFAKIVIILLVARYLSELKRDEIGIRDLLKIGVLVGIPTLLVMRQPDLGTSLTYVAILGAGVLLAGLRWHHLAVIALVGGLSLPIAWPFLNDYQKKRLETFVNPDADPRGAGYQVIQSRIAVGHGGMWGTGATRGTQTQLRFLPVAHTDFIFSAFAEEHGFVGVVVVLGLYFLLILQIVQNAQAAPDRSGMYLCMGVAALLLFHVFVNVGMVTGRMPVTGIPLPLMSSGGSHMFSVFMMLGLVNNVRLRRFAS
jgi:rod shape determining protein RodA